MITVDGFVLEKPAAFRTEEVRLVSEPSPGAQSTNLLIESRALAAGETAQSLGAAFLAQLTQSMPGINNPVQDELAFDDGGTGCVVSCGISSESGHLRQYCVLRVHEGRVCTASLTTPVVGVSRENAMAMMKCLTSLRPA